MVQATADVVIIGGGVIGLCVANALLDRGYRDVVVLEKGAIGSGASGKSGALIRMHYTNEWDARLARASFDYFTHWGEIHDLPDVFHQAGFLMVVGPDHAGHLAKNVEMLRSVGVNTHVVDAQEMTEIEPEANVDGVGAAAFEPDSGYVDGPRMLAGLAERLRRGGVVIAEGVAAQGIRTEGETVRGVETSVGPIACQHVVVATGAWTPHLLDPLGIATHARSKRIITHFVAWPETFTGHRVYLDNVVGTYFRPDHARFSIVGARSMEWDIDPDALTTEINGDATDQARARLVQRLPALAQGRPSGGRSAFDSFSDDMHAIIDHDVNCTGLHLLTGFSGAGFKIAPAAGEAIAEVIVGGESVTHDISAFRHSRFEENDPIVGPHEYPVMAGTGTRLA